MTDEDGAVGGTEFVDPHLRAGGGKVGGRFVRFRAPAIQEAVCRDCPLQCDERTVKRLRRHKLPIQPATFFFQDSRHHFHAAFAQHGDAATGDL